MFREILLCEQVLGANCLIIKVFGGEHTLKIMNIVPPLNIQKKDIRLKSMTLKGNLMIMSYMLST